MKKWIIGLAILLLVSACETNGFEQEPQQPAQETQGEVIMVVTDKAADMEAVSAIMITVEKVELQSPEGNWVTVSASEQTYNLLELQGGNHSLLVDENLAAGIYNQMRLQISEVVVTDTMGEHDAKLPSHELKLVGNIEIQRGETTAVILDFIADESLHTTGQGDYIFAPVIQMEARHDPRISIQGQRVQISGGEVKLKTKMGMDAQGKVGINVRIPADAELEIDPIRGALEKGAGIVVKGKVQATAVVEEDGNSTEASIKAGIY